ncbi:DUF551 domain-containing protein [Escherichia coli O10]
MAYAFHHALSDSSLGADEVEEIKTGLRAAFPNVAVQPTLIVPNEIEPDDSNTFDYVDGWNACRAAMLQGKSEQPQNAQQNIPENIPGGNSPVIPDGWISCSEQMPSAGEQVLAYRQDAPESNDPLIKMATYVGGSAHGHGFDCYCKPTHWMPLPAAPQQEVNRG